ncbi:epoxide hydrolase-like protein [Actinocorallia herbida]|uniref:Epoxide hydrolase-like protein n=1 Tax=Actinocorallia herbida TaxID=58109 RepID=A0A3N1CZM7_9ACTN|nr:epoxide hydrolase N-terminal domain-containing protein [Actinocorallia herbida]ROO86731.1 epoxide hydrolase-like protein [Actinocorallia herbida]
MPEFAPLIAVGEAEPADLRARLRATRWATPWPVDGGEAGTDPSELRRLVAYWADGYDWRAHEAALNALPSRFADLDGTPVHYLLSADLSPPSSAPSAEPHRDRAARRDGVQDEDGAGTSSSFSVRKPPDWWCQRRE